MDSNRIKHKTRFHSRNTVLDRLKKCTDKFLRQRQKGLQSVICDDFLVIKGMYCLYENDVPFTFYEVKIIIHAKFPKIEPIVLETGKKIIPRTGERHINPDGTCCIGIWEEWLFKEDDHSISNFLDGIVHDYFVQEEHYEQFKEWKIGERSHGEAGVIESFSEILGVAPKSKKVISYLRILASDWPKGHCMCPCGSGKILRKCHRKDVWEMHENIPPYLAKKMLKKILANTPKKITKK